MDFKREWIFVLLLAVAFAVRADLTLSAVILSQGGSSVLVNGKMYRIGAEVDGFVVVDIEPQSATFRYIATGEAVVVAVGGSTGLLQESPVDSRNQQAAQYVSGVIGGMETDGISSFLPPGVNLPPAFGLAVKVEIAVDKEVE